MLAHLDCSALTSEFCFKLTRASEIPSLSLHDALPIYRLRERAEREPRGHRLHHRDTVRGLPARPSDPERSEEHTSELQSRRDIVCRLLLEKKKIAYTSFKNTKLTPIQSQQQTV